MESSWRSKIDRARQHASALAEEVGLFLADEPYRIGTSRDGNDLVVRVHDLVPVPLMLSLLAGDAVHNARTALDHLVMELAGAGRGSLGRGPRTDSEERRLSFPVAETETGFRQWARDVEPYLSRSAISMIETLQSFRLVEQLEHDNGPLTLYEREAQLLLNPLARLHRLDNQDKHRRLALSLWFPGTVEQGAAAQSQIERTVSITEPVTDPEILAMLADLDRREAEDPDPTSAEFYFAGGPVTDGAELGRFIRADSGGISTTLRSARLCGSCWSSRSSPVNFPAPLQCRPSLRTWWTLPRTSVRSSNGASPRNGGVDGHRGGRATSG